VEILSLTLSEGKGTVVEKYYNKKKYKYDY